MNTGVGNHSLLQGDFPDPGIEPRYPALQVGFFTIQAIREAQTNIVSNGERQLFSLRLGIRQGFSLSTFLLNIVLEVTNISVRQKKKKKRHKSHNDKK